MSKGGAIRGSLRTEASLSASAITITSGTGIVVFVASVLLHSWWAVQAVVLAFIALGCFYSFSGKLRYLNHVQIGVFLGLLAGVVVSGAVAL
tara:strand:+ start:5732 stop:6007 length:276 start_codon:yes stop_codon:yes gene_type:complete